MERRDLIDFYWNPYSPFAVRVHFFLEEAGLPYRLRLVDFRRDDQKSPAFLAINPLGAVPTVVVDGFALAESNAIIRHLCARFSLETLYPVGIIERARVDEAWEFASHHICRWLQVLAWERVWCRDFGLTGDAAGATAAERSLAKNLPRLVRLLAGRDYLAGTALSAADVALLPFAAVWREVGVRLDEWPEVAAWLARMESRPAWRAVAAERDAFMAATRAEA